jgi:hypothetical protein
LVIIRLRIQQNLDGIGNLRFDSQVDLDQQQLDQSIGQWSRLLSNLLEDESAHHARVVIDHRHEDIRARYPHRGVLVSQREVDNLEQSVLDEVRIEL